MSNVYPIPATGGPSFILVSERGRTMQHTAAQILTDMDAEYRAALGDARLQELRLMLQELVDRMSAHVAHASSVESTG